MATTHRTRPAPTASDRPYRVALLVAYPALVLGLAAAATLSAAYLAAAVPLGLGGFAVLAGAWLGAVAASPGLARRLVGSVAARIREGNADSSAVTDDDVDPSAVTPARATSTGSK